MRLINLGPLRCRTTSCACWVAPLWGALSGSHQQRVSFVLASKSYSVERIVLRTAQSSLSSRGSSVSKMQAAASPSPEMSAAEDAKFHVVAFCRKPEDADQVKEVVKEVAATGCGQGSTAGIALVMHLDPVTVPPGAAPALNAARCCQRLARPVAEGGTRTMGRVLLAAATLGSTQELLRTYGSALGDGAVVVADRQTGGKGRGGNQWTSPLGCLMFSALRRLRVISPAQAPFINYLVCLAVTRGVRRALQESGLPALDIRVKWPNDIYAAGVKIAGALIHTSWQGGCFNVIAGIGLNVNNRTPTTCLDELLEQAAETQAASGGTPAASPSVRLSVSREAVLTGILASLEDVYDTFEQQGFTSLESEYLDTWLHSGQVLDFDDSDPATIAAAVTAPTTCTQGSISIATGTQTGSARPMTRLTIRGLSPSGFLLGEDAVGGRYELTPDGNSLDMMQGLIRRKVH